MAKRKSISKKIRFEVFKRDSFKCQYCGRTAPDVVLHIDHIKPVSEGGTNHITNLITSCADCNLGKGPILLDDHSIIEKQRKQLEELNQRREQLELMMQWREGLMQIDEEKMNIIKEKWSEKTGYSLNEHGEKDVKKLIKKFNLNLILDCMEISSDQYLVLDHYGEYTQESVEKAFNFIGRICTNKSRDYENPDSKDLYYIRGILRNRLSYVNEKLAISLLRQCYENGASVQSLKELALDVKNWTDFKRTLENFLEGGSDAG